MMHEVASSLLDHNLEKTLLDVPTELQHGTHKWPLGRYLRRQLRSYIGRDKKAPEQTTQSEEQMQTLRETAFATSQNLKTLLLEVNKGKRINMEARERRKSKGHL